MPIVKKNRELVGLYTPKEDFYKRDNEVFISNHSKYGFVEPIFAFLPSIAITQIIKVPEEFSPKWKNSYLIASLRNLSLYRVVFDENYSRIIIAEKMIIGKKYVMKRLELHQ